MQNRSLRTLAAVLVVGISATACGGDDDTVTDGEDVAAIVTGATDPATEGTEAATESPEPEAPAPPSDNGASAAAGSGFVNVDGTLYEVTVFGCLNMAGAMGGRFEGAEDPENVGGNFSFSPNDWATRNASEGWTEPGSLTLRVEDPYLQFESGATLVEGYVLPDGVSADDIVITRFQINEQATSVEGEAMFLEINALMTGVTTEPTPGSFEFNCPPS